MQDTTTAPPVRQRPHSIDAYRNGVVAKYRFANGYGASVIRHRYSYGGPQGLWELGVISEANGWHLVYDTPVTSDVLGWLTDADLQAALDAIEALGADQ